jgi:outer membrane lipoprotein carrier protein
MGIKGSLLAITLSLFGSQVFAETAPDAEQPPAAELSFLLSTMESLRADFTQVITDDQQIVLQETSGHALVKRPGHLKWEVTNPFHQLIISNGEVLWRYDADLEQAVRQPFDPRLSHTPSLLLSGEVSSLKEHYRVEKRLNENEEMVFSLYPLEQESLFDFLTITFKEKLLAGMEIIDGFGQRTSLQFSNIEINPVLESQLFEFMPPADVDVIIDE